MLAAFAPAVIADFSENFDAYSAGSALPAPWVNNHRIAGSSLGMNVSPSPSGFGGAQGADGPDGSHWREQERSTGYDTSATGFCLSWKARLLARANAIPRLNIGIGNAAGFLTFEMRGYADGSADVLGSFPGHPDGAVALPVLRDRWYRFTVALTDDGAGTWSWSGQAAEIAGGGFSEDQSLGSGSLPAGFTPGIAHLSSIYAFEEGPAGSEMSAIDDVQFISVDREVGLDRTDGGAEAPDDLLLSFNSLIDETYRIQVTTNLCDTGGWVAYSVEVGGTGNSLYLMDPDAGAWHRFYRVVSAPRAGTPTANLAASYAPVLEPNYWGFQQPRHGDHGQLIDGVIVETWSTPQGEIYSLPSSMGWASRRAVVLFDLGWVRPVSGFGLHTVFSPWGPWWPHRITMLVSDDGSDYRVAGPTIAVDPQDLVPPLDPVDVQHAIDRNPLGTPSTHWFWHRGYQTRGRYVTLVMEPHPDVGTIVLDEVEIYEGTVGGILTPPTGTALSEGEGGYSSYLLREALSGRMTQDVAALRQEITSSSLAPGQQLPLTDAVDAIKAQIPTMPVPPTNGFQAILPVADLHEDLFQVQADFRQALHQAGGGGTTEADMLHVWQSHRWDPLPLVGALGPETASVNIVMARNAFRSDVLNLSYAGTAPVDVEFTASGLPAGNVAFFQVPWTDTRALKPVASALVPIPVSGGTNFRVSVTPGLSQQVWIRFDSHGMAATVIHGSLTLRVNGQAAAAVPVNLDVLPPTLPDPLSLSIGGWDYPWPGVMQVTVDNVDDYADTLREYGVNTPWISGSLPVGTHAPDGALLVPPDRSEIDFWVQHWPTSRWHAVAANAPVAHPDAVIAAWAVDWENYLALQGIPSDEVLLLLIDEPNTEAELNDILRAGQAIKGASSFKIFNDIHYADPTTAPAVISQVLALATDVQCFNVGLYLQFPAEHDAFMAAHTRPGLEWWCYTGGQADRLSDPYVAWLLRSWFSFQEGLRGTHWWAFGDGNGGFSWNEYFSNGPSRTPLFVDHDSVTTGKSMEAMREGVQDYEILSMLATAYAGEPPGPTRDAMGQILFTDLPAVLTSHTIGLYPWSTVKDRTQADQVRIQALQLLP